MLRKYLSDIAFMQLINLLIKPIWIFVIDRKVQEILPEGVYGNYFALFNFSLLFFIVLDLGLNTFNTTQISRDTKKIASITGSILGLKILLSIVYTILVIFIGSTIGYSTQEFGLLILLCGLQIITSFNQYLRSIVASLQKFKWDGVFMVLDRAVAITLCAFLIWGGIEAFSLTIDRFIYAQIIGVGVVLVVLLIFLRRHLSNVSISFSLKKISPLLTKSWPFALLITLMGLYNYIDGVMIKSLVGDNEVGVYALGYRLFYALLMFAQIFSGVLLAFFSKNINDKGIINRVATYTAKMLMCVAIAAAAISFAYKMEIIELLYPNKASLNGSISFSILMVGFIGSSLIIVYGTLLTAGVKLKQLNKAALVTLLLNLILNTYLIPLYGARGAAMATVVSQLLFGTSCYLISYKKYQFAINSKELIKQIMGVIIVVGVGIYLKQYFSSTLVHLLMFTVSVIVLAYFFKLFEGKHLKSLLRR